MSARSWKPDAGDAGRAPSGPPWRQDTGAEAPVARQRWRWGRILFLFVFFGGLTAALVWVSLWLRPAKDTSLVLAGAHYQDNLVLPPNLYGWQGLKDLADHARSLRSSRWDAGQLQLFGEPREVRLNDDWQRDLRKFRGKTLVVFLSLHGGADRNGAYLLTQNALLPRDAESQEKDKIRLDDVLERLAKIPKDRFVVLVLDCTQMTECWPLGMLHNDFARALDKLDEKITGMPNLLVMSASDVDQRSWVSEEWKRTIFQHYFLEGLRGAADAADNEPRDGRITAYELYQYVARNVKSWVQTNRDAVQTPVLLPRGAAGLQRAKEMHLTLAPAYVPADPGQLSPFVPPAELVAAWDRHAALAQQRPAPAVYAPTLWRLYQERLLRYEQLLRAGAAEAALTTANRLKELEQEIARAATRDFASEKNTLTMMAATGHAPAPLSTILRSFNQLWDASAKEQAKIWLDMQNQLVQPGKLSLAQLRLMTMAVLLERAAEDPANFDKVYHLLQLVEDPLYPRPAEVHFFVMLRRDLPSAAKRDEQQAVVGRSGIPAALLKRALEVRLRAEKAILGLQDSPARLGSLAPGAHYPYAEQVFAWLWPWIEEADTQRRLGQDLLFGLDAAAWASAEKKLAEADRLYQEAQRHALTVRHALAVRDEVQPQLVFYARWLGARRPGEAERRAGELAADNLAQLCRQTHVLAQLLEEPPAKRSPEPFKKLSDQADAVWRAFQDLQAWARTYRQGLDEVDLPSVWRDIHSALEVPFLDGKQRLELLARESRIGYRLLTRQAAALPAPDREAVVEEAPRARAVRQGKLALAVLGQRWFDECGQNVLEQHDLVQGRLKEALTAEKWWQFVAQAGAEIGQRWHKLPEEIRRLQPTKDKAAEAGWGPFRKIDRLTRLADVRTALMLNQNPIQVHRQVLLEDLLYEQARRTFLERWQAEDPSKEPYYRTAAFLYLKDAQALPQERFAGTDPRLADLRAKIVQAGSLALALAGAPGFTLDGFTAQIEKTPTWHFTSEKIFPLQFRLAIPDDAEGFPALWAETGPGLRFAPGTLAPGTRILPDIQGKPQLVFNWTLESPVLRAAAARPPDLPQATASQFTVRGLYRGRSFATTVHIDLHPLPHVVFSEQPLPWKGSLTVRAGKEVQHQFGASNGAITIVLDCSGSMRPPQGQPFNKSTKFVEATDALEQMLKKVPKGTVVSLWAFGQAVGAAKTVEAAEETITPILEPTPWDPDDPKQLASVMARVAYPALEPWNESPIVRAMLTAARDLRKSSGFRTLVVLTDGMDNRFDKDPEMIKLKKDIPTTLRDAFPDIEVNLVGFKFPNKEEEEKARRQFKVIEELPLPGKFYQVNQGPDLIAALEKSLKQKLRYWVDTEDKRPLPGTGQAGLEVGTDASNEQWYPGGLDPGGYRVRVHTNQKLSRAVALNLGDLLLLELGPSAAPGAGADKFDLQRLVYSLADFPYKPAREKSGWRLAALQTQRLVSTSPTNSNERTNGLQMLVTLEKKPDPLVPTIQQHVPARTWLELALPEGYKAPYAVRWHYQPGYPAPAWSLESPRWPTLPGSTKAFKPIVRAWWSPDVEPTGKALERSTDFQQPLDIDNRSLVLGKETVVIESVQVEEQTVQTAPATPRQPAVFELKPCLVVRVRHAQGKPVWVRVKGVNAVGAEHRFYSEAGKYAGVFWPVTRDEAALHLQKIEVLSLSAFKEAAAQRQYDLELDNTYEPQVSDNRPLPPANLNRWLVPVPMPLVPTSK